MVQILTKAADWLVTRLVWVVVGFLLCIPLFGNQPEYVAPQNAPLGQVIAQQTMPTALKPPVEASVTVHVSTGGVVIVQARRYGLCVSPGFGMGHAGYPLAIADVKLAYAGGWGAGVGLGIGRGVFPYWAIMWDPRKRGWSLFLGGGIIEKRAIFGIRVRF